MSVRRKKKKKKKKHAVICSVRFAPNDFTRKFSFKDERFPKRDDIGVVLVPKFHSVRSSKKDIREEHYV